MFLFSRPSSEDIERFLRNSRGLSLSYEPVGLATQANPRFDIDEQRTVIGSGEAVFERAKHALAHWRHLHLGWVEVFPPKAPITPGSVVAVLVRHLGFWSLNGCQVVYSVESSSRNEFGFAYGTLTNHAEKGEEVFQIVFRPESGEVVYVIRAASKPRATLARVGYPFVRLLQARFRKDCAEAMRRAVAG